MEAGQKMLLAAALAETILIIAPTGMPFLAASGLPWCRRNEPAKTNGSVQQDIAGSHRIWMARQAGRGAG